MKTKTTEISITERQPPVGKTVEVKCPMFSDGWLKGRLIKGGKFPLFESREWRGTLGMVTAWRETA